MPNSSAAPTAPASGLRSFSPRDIAYLFFRYKERVIGFAAAVTLAALAAVWLMPPVYESDAKLLVRRGRETVALDPTVDSAKIIPVYTELMNDINSEIAILKSRELAEQVVKDMGVDKFVKTPDAPGFNAVGSAVEALMREIKIDVQEKSYIITIQYANRDPEMARQVVARLIDLYLAKHIAVFQTSGAYELFKEQSDQLRKSLEKADADLRNFKNLFGIASLDAQQTIVAGRLRSIQEQTERVQTSLAASHARVEKIKQIQAGSTNESTRSALIATEDYRRLQSDLMQEEVSISAATAQATELRRLANDAQTELDRLNESELRIGAMEREKAIIEAQYRKYAESLEQTRINRTLEGEKMSNIRVVQSASLPVNPKPLHKGLRLLVALVFAALGGFGIALVSEHIDHTFSRPEDVDRVLRIPTLVSVPSLPGLAGLRPGTTWSPPVGGQSREVNKAWQVSEEAGDTFETLRHRVLQALKPGSNGTVVLGVTSCHLGEGTTFVATNLAITLARYAEDSQVLYVDASQYVRSRREGDSKLLGASELQANEQGDVNVVERNLYTVQPPDAVKPSSVPAKTAKAYDRLVPLIRQRNYSFVVVDIPPLNEGIASLRLGGPLDAVILVIETEKVRWEAARWGLELLQGANANILGAVLNKRRLHIPEWIYRRL